jgi:hypothetical protein
VAMNIVADRNQLGFVTLEFVGNRGFHRGPLARGG